MSDNSNEFEDLYLQEKQKAKMSMIVASIAVTLALGSFIYAGQKKVEDPVATSPTGQQFERGNFAGGTPGGPGGFGGQGGPGGLGIDSYIDDSGSVDTDAIDDFLANIPADFKPNLVSRMDEQIDQAFDDGEITSTQASELKDAFGL